MLSDEPETFKRALSRVVEGYERNFGLEECTATAEHGLEQGSWGALAPTVEVTGSREPFLVAVTYASPLDLERALEGYLEIGGVRLRLDQSLPSLARVCLLVYGAGVDKPVTFEGRAVQQTADGMAFHLDPVPAENASALKALPEKMRRARESGNQDGSEENSPPRHAAVANNASSAGNPFDDDPPHGFLPVRGAPLRSWRLDPEPLNSVLCKLLTHTGLAVLDVELRDCRAQVVLDDSDVLRMTVSPPVAKASLEYLLRTANKLDDAQIKRVRRFVSEHGKSVAEALVELDIFSSSAISVALKMQTRILMEHISNQQQGTARLYALEKRPALGLHRPSPLSYHLYRCIRRTFATLGDDWLDEREGYYLGQLITRRESPACEIEALELKEDDVRLYELVLENKRPLEDIVRLSRLPKSEILVLLECFRRLGMLHCEENPWTRRFTQFVEDLERMRSRLDSMNHFEVLGVNWTARAVEIEFEYRKFMTNLSVERLPSKLSPSVIETVEEVRNAVTKSYEFLCDRDRRTEHRSEIVDRLEMKRAMQIFEE